MRRKISKLEKIDENQVYLDNEIRQNKYNSYNQISWMNLIYQFISKFLMIPQMKTNNK
jgi:hypothetical protein